MNRILPKKMTFTFLIAPSKEHGYLGMCRETGFVESGDDPEKLEKRLVDATGLLVNTVKSNPECLPNLYTGLDWRNKITFYSTLIKMVMQRFSQATENFFFFTRNISFFTPQYA